MKFEDLLHMILFLLYRLLKEVVIKLDCIVLLILSNLKIVAMLSKWKSSAS